MASKVAMVRVEGHEIREGDTFVGQIVSHVISPGRFRVEGASGVVHVAPRDLFCIYRPVTAASAERGTCAFCTREIALIEKGKGDAAKKIMLVHGPAKDRCRGSKLSVAEAQAEYDEIVAQWTVAETATA